MAPRGYLDSGFSCLELLFFSDPFLKTRGQAVGEMSWYECKRVQLGRWDRQIHRAEEKPGATVGSHDMKNNGAYPGYYARQLIQMQPK